MFFASIIDMKQFLTCILLLSGTLLSAQTLKGRITDTKGNAIPDATLFVKEIKFGTSANQAGLYEIQLSKGTYTCTFQCLGYETQTHTVNISQETTVLDIVMQERAYELEAVVISNKREDPAYGIMRRAIAMTPYYLNQVSDYKASVYLKGSLHIIKISRIVRGLAKEELKDFKDGNTYIEETINEIEFTAPNKYKQKVLSKTGNMPQYNDEPMMQMITASVYDPQAILPVISPLSTNAFAHYRFRYDGYIEEGGRLINKIKITPIHKSKQLVSGYIYIADNYWNVYSVDLSGDFVIGGAYRLKVSFGEVENNIWLPVSHQIDFNGSILGNKGDFHYVTSIKYAQIVENTLLKKPDAIAAAEQQREKVLQPQLSTSQTSVPQTKNQKKIEQIVAKEELSNRDAYQLAKLMQKEAKAEADKKKDNSLDLTDSYYDDYKVEVDSNAYEQDTAYWAKMRPVPLMPNEIKGYQESSTEPAWGLRLRMDTAQKVSKTSSPFWSTVRKVTWGTNIKLGESGGVIEYRGLKPSKLGFNTVDGFFIGQKITYYKDFASARENRLTITPEAIWAINRKAFMWNVNTRFTYAPMRRAAASLNFGRQTTDFNATTGMYPFENTVSSLFFRRNYLKLFDQSFIEANNTIDVINGMQLITGVAYARRTMLDNVSDYSFFYRDSRDYSPNIPTNNELNSPPEDNINASFYLSINYTPRFFYRVDRNNRKRMVRSDWPTFSATWRKGIKDVWNSDSDYDFIALDIRQSIETGMMQHLAYRLSSGTFVNKKNIAFPDYKHFRTLEIPVTIGSIESSTFNLLEYYRYSTRNYYAEAHVYFTTPFLVLKYLPFFNDRLWSEGLQLSYLYTPEMKHYFEFGYTIGLIWRAGVFVGFEDFSYRSVGVRLSLPLGLIID